MNKKLVMFLFPLHADLSCAGICARIVMKNNEDMKNENVHFVPFIWLFAHLFVILQPIII